MSSFRGIVRLFPWRQWPPIGRKVKRLKSEVRAVCLLKHRKPQTAETRREYVPCNNFPFFPSSFWCRTLNGINIKVPRLHLIFPWRLKNLSSGFKWLGMQVCFSVLIFLKCITLVCLLFTHQRRQKDATYRNKDNVREKWLQGACGVARYDCSSRLQCTHLYRNILRTVKTNTVIAWFNIVQCITKRYIKYLLWKLFCS